MLCSTGGGCLSVKRERSVQQARVSNHKQLGSNESRAPLSAGRYDRDTINTGADMKKEKLSCTHSKEK
jgi:hypothetical protein